ncbi:MAG: c-type cytochrome [Planctomycetes bacterium]|nr:c-type cytochrome [Planctomycetota bacterium]
MSEPTPEKPPKSLGRELMGWVGAAAVGVVCYVVLSSLRDSTSPLPEPPPNATDRVQGSVAESSQVRLGAPKRSLGLMSVPRESGLELIASYRDDVDLAAGDVLLELDGQSLAGRDGAKRLLARLNEAAPDEVFGFKVRKAGGEEVQLKLALLDPGKFELALADEMLGVCAAFLTGAQRDDGLWPGYRDPAEASVAVSALALAALRELDDSDAVLAARDAAAFALRERQAPDGGVHEPQDPISHRVYANALLLRGLGDDPAQADFSEQVRRWLVQAQLQETPPPWCAEVARGEPAGVGPFDFRYGGWSYHGTYRPNGRLRADLSTARFALQGLTAAELDAESPAWGRALMFLELTQNLTLLGEGENEPRYRDGGFAFHPRNSKAGNDAVDDLIVYRSYGSATADGLVSLLAAEGIDQRAHADPELPDMGERVRAALLWLARNYDLKGNPGFTESQFTWTQGIYFYYLSSLAEGLHQAGVWEIRGQDGSEHVWPAELIRALRNEQHGVDAPFANKSTLMHEDNPVIATSFVVFALTAARDRLRVGSGALLAADTRPPRPVPLFVRPADDAVGRGRQVFHASACTGCHLDAGGGNAGSLVGIGDAYAERHRGEAARRLRAFLERPSPEGALRPVKAQLRMQPISTFEIEGERLDDLVAYLMSRTGNRGVSEDRP